MVPLDISLEDGEFVIRPPKRSEVRNLHKPVVLLWFSFYHNDTTDTTEKTMVYDTCSPRINYQNACLHFLKKTAVTMIKHRHMGVQLALLMTEGQMDPSVGVCLRNSGFDGTPSEGDAGEVGPDRQEASDRAGDSRFI